MPVVDSAITSLASATSLPCTMPAHASGDVLFAWCVKDNSSGTFSHSGSTWTEVGEYNGGAERCVLFRITAASASETLTVTHTDSARPMSAIVVSVDDVDTADIIEVNAQNAFSNDKDPQFPVATTVNNQCLVLYFGGTDQDRELLFDPGVIVEKHVEVPSGCAAILGYTWQETAGAVPRPKMYLLNNDSGVCLTLCINSSSGNAPAYTPFTEPPWDWIHPLHSFNSTFGGSDGGDPTTDLPTIAGSTTTTTTANGIEANRGYDPYISGFNIRSQTANLTDCELITIPSVDLSGSKIMVHALSETLARVLNQASVADTGVMFGLRSNAGTAYRIWNIAASNSLKTTKNYLPAVIDVDDADECVETFGTFDSTDVDGFVPAVKNNAAGDCRVKFYGVIKTNTAVLIGGSSTTPAKLSDIEKITQSNLVVQTTQRLGASQTFCLQDVQLGHDTEDFHIEDSGFSFVLPTSATGNDQQYWPDAAPSFTIIGRASQTLKPTAGTISCATAFSLEIDISGGTNDLSGLVIEGASGGVTFTSVASGSLNGLTLRGAAAVPADDPLGTLTVDATGNADGAIEISGATQAAIQADVDNLANATLSNSAIGFRLIFTGAAADIAIVGPANLSLSNTVDLHYESTNASQLTFTPGSGADVPTTSFSGAATGVTVDSSTPITISAPNLPDGTYYELFNNTRGSTALDNDTVSGGTGASYTSTIGAGLDIQDGDEIELRAMFHSSGSYKEPDTGHDGPPIVQQAVAGSNVTFLTQMVDWEALNTWGHDATTLTEFTADALNIDIDIDDADGISQRTRIVAFWAGDILCTASGIRSFWGAYTVESAASVKQNVATIDIHLHNVGTLNVVFNDDTVRYYRSDGSNPYDSSGNSIFMHYNGTPHTVDTGSGGFGSADRADLQAAKSSSATASSKSTESNKILKNKNTTDPATGKQQIFDDDDTTVLLEADLFQDAAGATQWDGTTGINRKARLA